MSVAYSNPGLTLSSDGKSFTLNNPMMATWVDPQSVARSYHIDAGFKTDLASIPLRLQGIIGKMGKHALPAIMHDAAYEGWFKPMSKADADLMFLEGMKSQGVNWLKRNVMWLAVRANINGGHW